MYNKYDFKIYCDCRRCMQHAVNKLCKLKNKNKTLSFEIIKHLLRTLRFSPPWNIEMIFKAQSDTQSEEFCNDKQLSRDKMRFK